MKFDHLLASIQNNAQEEPTIYMALCMVESLFMDIEHACGSKFSRCPVGDESLPNMLIWLCRQINKIYEDNNDELQNNRKRLDATKEKLDETHNQLQGLSDATEQLISLRAELSMLEGKLESRKAEAQECKDLEAMCDQARQRLGALQAFDAAAAKQELDALQTQIALQEASMGSIDAQMQQAKQTYARLEGEYGKAAQNIGLQKNKNEKLQENLRHAIDTLRLYENESQRLQSDVNMHVQELTKLQAEVERLDKNELPLSRELCEQERMRRDILSRTMEEAEKQCAFYREEIARMEEVLPKLEENMQNEKAVYDAMTAKLTKNSAELEELKAQINQLQGNNDAELLQNFRNQLADKKQQLNQIQVDCERLEEENALKEKELEESLKRRTKLEEIKRAYESGLEAAQKQQKELAFAKDPRYLQIAVNMQERVKLLHEVRGKLEASLANIREILCKDTVANTATLEERVQCDMQLLGNHIEKLRSALLECAESVKLEEE